MNNPELQSKLNEIIGFLDTYDTSNKGTGILAGQTGISMFYYFLAKVKDDENYLEKSLSIVQQAVDEINEGNHLPSFCSGISGLGWYLEFLRHEGVIQREDIVFLDQLDEYLYRVMINHIDQGYFDYLHGSIGIALYFLKRIHSPQIKNYLDTFIDRLYAKGNIFSDGSMAWKTIWGPDKDNDVYNLSLSHGLASITAFLAKAYEADIKTAKVKEMLSRSLDFFFKHKNDEKKCGSYFPSVISPEDRILKSRLAWCYGDLGIASVFYNISKSMADKDLEKFSIDVFNFNASRKDPADTNINDAGICHGAFGIAHLYNRFFFNTKNPDFRITSEYWMKEGLKMACHKDGYAGYKTFHTEDQGGWVANASLLEGISGIGLSILSSASMVEPSWDECLLLC